MGDTLQTDRSLKEPLLDDQENIEKKFNAAINAKPTLADSKAGSIIGQALIGQVQRGYEDLLAKYNKEHEEDDDDDDDDNDEGGVDKDKNFFNAEREVDDEDQFHAMFEEMLKTKMTGSMTFS